MKTWLGLLLVSSLASAAELNVAGLLQSRTLNDATYSKATAPAQSLDTNKSESERIQQINAAIASEIKTVTDAFKGSKDAAVSGVRQAAQKIDGDLAGSTGGIQFAGSNPTSAQARVLYVVPKSGLKGNVALTVLNALTSYKRSAKMNDFVFEYQEPLNLTMGQMKEMTGTETSWKKPEAQKEFSLGQNYAIKKCRQLLGWRCVTSIYRADEFSSSSGKVYTLYISLYDLDKNQDHANYAGDKRSKNQIHGSTALYVIRETADWVMVFGSDHQYLNDKQSFSGAIEKEFKKDADRFKERIALDLGISADSIR